MKEMKTTRFGKVFIIWTLGFLFFGLFLWARSRLAIGILVIPLIMSISGIIPFVLGLYADIGLVRGGIGGFLLALQKKQ